MKKVYLLILFAFYATIGFAQIPSWLWAKPGAGSDYDWGSSVTADASGNVIATGYFSSATISFGSVTLTNSGFPVSSSDIFVVKYSPSGNVLWAKSIGGINNEFAFSIATDTSDNIYIAGQFFSPTIAFGTTTLLNAGSSDIIILKYDSNGIEQWAKSEGGTDSDWSYSVTTDLSGNVYLTGGYQSITMSFGATTLTNNGLFDMFILKYDSLGNKLMAKSAGGTGIDFGNDISVDQLGNINIVGAYSTNIIVDTTNLINAGAYDILTVKYDSAGNVLWAKGTGGATNDVGQGISNDALGNVFITGYYSNSSVSFGSTTLTNAGGKDVFFVKYDLPGNVLWAKSSGGIDDDAGVDATVDVNNNLIITGSFRSSSISFGTSTFSSSGVEDIFLAKYDPAGNIIWAKKEGGINSDFVKGIYSDALENVYITGYYYSPTITFGTTNLSNSASGIGDVFVAKLNSTTGINDIFDTDKFSISPNPSSGVFEISVLEKTAGSKMEVYDCLGRIIKQAAIQGAKTVVDLSGFPKGIYFIKLVSTEGTMVKKIVIE